METYLESLKNCYRHQANPDNAAPMKQYMRNQFQFLGIKSPEAKRLFRQFTKQHGLPKITDIEAIVEEMWCWPEREYQYVALSLLDKLQKQLTPEHLSLLEKIIVTKSWWDTVDSIAIHNVGKLLKQYPDRREDAINSWRHSDNIWLRRTTLLFQLDYKTDTDMNLLFSLIRDNKNSSEFFLRKAVGWALREYSKVAPETVKEFVATETLAPLSRREALKWMKAKGQLD